MDEHTSHELAYKKGYEQGKRDAVKRGRWKKTYTAHGEWLWGYECNQCKADNPRASYFCPNCGADMRGEEDGK